MLHVLEKHHALVVLNSFGLHLGDGLTARLGSLRRDDRPRILQRRLEHGDDVEGVRRAFGIEDVERGDGKRRQRLVQGEVLLQLDGEPHETPFGVGSVEPLDDATGKECSVDADRLTDKPVLRAPVFVVIAQ